MDSCLFHIFKAFKVNIVLSPWVQTPTVPIIATVTHFLDIPQPAPRLTPIYHKKKKGD